MSDRVQKEPQMKNTLGPRFADPGALPTIYGVMTAMIYSHLQFMPQRVCRCLHKDLQCSRTSSRQSR